MTRRHSESLSRERLFEVLSYSQETGEFHWRARPNSRSPRPIAGDLAGHLNEHGYTVIRIDGALYKAHRLAWLHVTGSWPRGVIDHVNGNHSDNRICNLRDVSDLVNNQNIRSPQRNNRVGLLGVSLKPDMKRPWAAQIQDGGKVRRLGFFDSPEAAHQAYLEAKRRLHEGCTL